jgi:hypothetical protein
VTRTIANGRALAPGRKLIQVTSNEPPDPVGRTPDLGNPLSLVDRSSVERGIANALKMAIEAHGPITAENRTSAAKRIYSFLKAEARQQARSRAEKYARRQEAERDARDASTADT